MSIEAVNKFLDKVAQDSTIQEELAQAMQAENDRQAVVDLGAKHGFEFTGDELVTEIEKRQKAAAESGELSEEELEAVAGGAFPIIPLIGALAPIAIAAINKAKW
ncbi:bacteriocin propeptide, TIGR03798 family/class IIb bacteriocin, lactobin A/cerein 7B family [Rivularia sp. PCC 7116]|uniref:Nif11-like leader peptide family natural product precursor n=1 Tax=Rivularia sp. PCC 7116 TaxID=373994 RepID=UPI00029EDF54|nr:Nif11-like leader peptide family natural product precursor [Rivularia sp. PCC 7116]AFY58613.1 bacteriocin propeptide, TIGR03798 family/class IIb bacteriocin, lactobin A/cerein 7B family [Rivularia sp. PCC 7116]